MNLSEKQSEQLLREIKKKRYKNWKEKQRVSPSHKFYKPKGIRPIFNIKPLQGGSPGLGKGKSWRKQEHTNLISYGGVDLVVVVNLWQT